MFVQALISGIAVGLIYALISVSMTVIYRASGVANFGHGDLVMAGAFCCYAITIGLGVPPVIGAVAAVVLLGTLGIFSSRSLLRPLRFGSHLSVALMVIAIGYLLRGVARYFWGRDVLAMPELMPLDPIIVGNYVVTANALVILVVIIALLFAALTLNYLTRVGMNVKALFQSEKGAMLVGINVRAYQDSAWALGAATAGIAGILIAPTTFLHPDLGVALLVKGFAAMALGGFGSFPGAVIGGVLLGTIELLLGVYVSTSLVEIAPYLAIILILVLFPNGLLGKNVITRI
jgi:branched-chain amino acid transport system permease protein